MILYLIGVMTPLALLGAFVFVKLLLEAVQGV